MSRKGGRHSLVLSYLGVATRESAHPTSSLKPVRDSSCGPDSTARGRRCGSGRLDNPHTPDVVQP
eukprot:2372978-Prymnesium_polylepis.1